MDNEIKTAFETLTPPVSLRDKIGQMIDSGENFPVKKRVDRPIKFIAIAAAAIIIAAAGVTAISGGSFWLPGLGIVDDSGKLVIAEGKLTSEVWSSEGFEFGGLNILGVTCSDGYAVRVAGTESVIPDLTLTLPDGSAATPGKTSFSFNKSVVYTFYGEFSEYVTLKSESLGDEKTVRLEKSEKSYVTATHGGLTLMLRPLTDDMSEYEIDFTEESEDFSDAIFKSIRDVTKKGKVIFYGSNGRKYTPTMYESSSIPDGGYISRVSIKKPENVAITSVEFNDLTFFCHENELPMMTIGIPDDGEYLAADVVIFDKAGLRIELSGVERRGNHLLLWFPGDLKISRSGGLSPGANETYDNIEVMLGIRSLEPLDGVTSDGRGFSFEGLGKAAMKNGRLCVEVEIDSPSAKNFDLGNYKTFTLTVDGLEFSVDGKWKLDF